MCESSLIKVEKKWNPRMVVQQKVVVYRYCLVKFLYPVFYIGIIGLNLAALDTQSMITMVVYHRESTKNILHVFWQLYCLIIRNCKWPRLKIVHKSLLEVTALHCTPFHVIMCIYTYLSICWSEIVQPWLQAMEHLSFHILCNWRFQDSVSCIVLWICVCLCYHGL